MDPQLAPPELGHPAGSATWAPGRFINSSSFLNLGTHVGSETRPSSTSAPVGVGISAHQLPQPRPGRRPLNVGTGRLIEQLILIHQNPSYLAQMLSLELRYASMFSINVLKTFVGAMDGRTWDAFGAMTNWNKFAILFVVFFILSFFSIRIPAVTSPSLIQVEVQRRFCPIVFFSFFFSLILPQRLCGLYFLVLWLSGYKIFSVIMKGFLHCLQVILSRVPGLINIGATSMDFVEDDHDILDMETGGAPQAGAHSEETENEGDG